MASRRVSMGGLAEWGGPTTAGMRLPRLHGAHLLLQNLQWHTSRGQKSAAERGRQPCAAAPRCCCRCCGACRAGQGVAALPRAPLRTQTCPCHACLLQAAPPLSAAFLCGRARAAPRPRHAPARATPGGGGPGAPGGPQKQAQKPPQLPGGTPEGPSGPPELPPRARRLLALLVEYGGVYGSAACLIGFFTHIDPFGAFHWDADDALQGLRLYAPLLLFDALVMLPDYSAKEDQADQISRLFFGPGAAAAAAAGTDDAASPATAAATPLADAPPPPPLMLRVQVALELLQSFQTRANPGIGLPLWQETLVGAVGSLADEMLYRAVALTFLGGWIPWGAGVPGGGGGGGDQGGALQSSLEWHCQQRGRALAGMEPQDTA
jgi:hypothetical protein